MTYNDYLGIVSKDFSKIEELQINPFLIKSMHEEEFKIEWLATKLKIFSFISCVNKIDLNDIVNYASICINYALKNYKGLPRGVQNGVTSFNVLVSENVTDEAIKFAISRPKKHFALFEMPIIYDLNNNKIYYYKETPTWGSIYYSYFRQYIEKHFNI
jgi:hypothetical protein